jgi:hypothetical protein
MSLEVESQASRADRSYGPDAPRVGLPTPPSAGAGTAILIMDQVYYYLGKALDLGFLVCFFMLMWQFLMHNQWKMVVLCLICAIGCGGILLGSDGRGPLSVGPGYLIAMIIGWQEAGNWKMKKLMRWYTGLFVVCFFLFTHTLYKTFTTAPPPPDAKTQARERARRLQERAKEGK